MYLYNSSVIATISVPDDDRVTFGAALGVRTNVRWSALMSSTFAVIKSGNKTVMYLVDEEAPGTLIVNSFMECVPDTGINMSDRSCNKTDMKTVTFMDQLKSPAWKLITDTNDGYPVLFKNIIRS